MTAEEKGKRGKDKKPDAPPTDEAGRAEVNRLLPFAEAAPRLGLTKAELSEAVNAGLVASAKVDGDTYVPESITPAQLRLVALLEQAVVVGAPPLDLPVESHSAPSQTLGTRATRMKATCRYCGRPTRAGSLCAAHEERRQRGYPPMDAPLRPYSRDVRACPECGKEQKYLTRGLCQPCYFRSWARERKEKGNASREA